VPLDESLIPQLPHWYGTITGGHCFGLRSDVSHYAAKFESVRWLQKGSFSEWIRTMTSRSADGKNRQAGQAQESWLSSAFTTTEAPTTSSLARGM
jgi:hypothetical protein